jgi:hypothetical protein
MAVTKDRVPYVAVCTAISSFTENIKTVHNRVTSYFEVSLNAINIKWRVNARVMHSK